MTKNKNSLLVMPDHDPRIKRGSPKAAASIPEKNSRHGFRLKGRNDIKIFGYAIIISLLVFYYITPVHAAALDTDQDGLTDEAEINIYHTNVNNPDTDGDGYKDGEEVSHMYSPLYPEKRLNEVDTDNDGINDWQEIKWGLNLANKDTDGDGHDDKEELDSGFDPNSTNPEKLEKHITVHIKTQKLDQQIGKYTLASFPVSTGKPGMPTPTGTFTIHNKDPRAWSKPAKLWMPWWMALQASGAFGIHELPEWPNGTKEGENHLGRPVSHGCIRLGVGPAKKMYDWAPTGTKVVIKKQ